MSPRRLQDRSGPAHRLTRRSGPARGIARSRPSVQGRSATATTSFALAQRVFASRPNSCARKSSRRPIGPPSCRRSRAASTCARKPVELLADIRPRRDQNRLLMKPVGIERRPCRRATAAICASRRARMASGLAGRATPRRHRRGAPSTSSCCRENRRQCLPFAGARFLQRRDQRGDRGLQAPRASSDPAPARRLSSSNSTTPADRQQPVDREAGSRRPAARGAPTASTSDFSTLRVDAQPRRAERSRLRSG